MTSIIRDGTIPNMTKPIDETQTISQTSVKKVVIDSAIADVNLTFSRSTRFEVHLSGRLDKDEDVDLEVEVADDCELRIKLKFTGCCYYSNLRLDVAIPHKTIKLIDVSTLTADVTLEEEMITEVLRVKTKHGNVDAMAKLLEADITTMSGNVELLINAFKDASIKVATITGDVSMNFQNIATVQLTEETQKRNVKNRHQKGVGHNALVDISTMCGDIRIR